MALFDLHNAGDTTYKAFNSIDWAACIFKATSSYSLTSVKLKLARNAANDPGTLAVSLREVTGIPDTAKPDGVDLISGTTNGSTLTTDPDAGEWREITFTSAYTLAIGAYYAIVIHAENGPTGAAYGYWRCGGVYADGNRAHSTNSGVSWTAYDDNYMFEAWGNVSPPVDVFYGKKTVFAGNFEIWYEGATTGSPVELEAATGNINTSKPLAMFEAFQKVIIANGSNLKVIDFINTKIDLGAGNELTKPPAKGDVLTQTTSGATMIVDFVDPTMRYIYGYVTGGTFVTTAGYTLTSNDGTAKMDPNPAPKPNVVSRATTTPHWYDYTIYPDIVLAANNRYGGAEDAAYTFGSLPAKAYLGCLYRGRVVLSGNPNYPHQWYMSRQADIWDYAYLANDAQSPVVGNNTDAGEVGDIITALISYKDDYLIFGCASSIWVLRGDPAAGGSLDEVDLTVGVFGANSWCFDGDGNLYFWGTNGIYVMPAGFGAVKCLTENTIPNIVNDEDVNQWDTIEKEGEF